MCSSKSALFEEHMDTVFGRIVNALLRNVQRGDDVTQTILF